jgi:AraC-like DNA-binding protein
MPAPKMIDRFARTILESADRQDVAEILFEGLGLRQSTWQGQDLLCFVRRLSATINDEFYGLASLPCPSGTSGLGMEIMALSRDLRDGLERCFRFYRLITGGMFFCLRGEGGLAAIEIKAADPFRDINHVLTEWQAVRWHKLAQWIIGTEIPLVRAEFSHAMQGPLAEYTQVFCDDCRFGLPDTRLYFEAGFLNRKIVRKLEELDVRKSAQNYDPVYTAVEKSWWKLLKISLCARLRKMESMPTMERLAEEFGVCSQTLRRRLKEERLTYRALKAQARREVVMDQICDERVSLAQISLMAGFAETNGLARAMKSWTGFSPSQYRKNAVHGMGRANTYGGRSAQIS